MNKVLFLEEFWNIPANFSTDTIAGGSICVNGDTYNPSTLDILERAGIIEITCPEFSCSSEPIEAGVTYHLVGEEKNKVDVSVGEDLNNFKFKFGEQYKFYDIENKVWKASRLKKTASHLGRIAGGFAVPFDATDRKMFNRLEKLNVMYSLGLTREVIRSITNYN